MAKNALKMGLALDLSTGRECPQISIHIYFKWMMRK